MDEQEQRQYDEANEKINNALRYSRDDDAHTRCQALVELQFFLSYHKYHFVDFALDCIYKLCYDSNEAVVIRALELLGYFYEALPANEIIALVQRHSSMLLNRLQYTIDELLSMQFGLKDDLFSNGVAGNSQRFWAQETLKKLAKSVGPAACCHLAPQIIPALYSSEWTEVDAAVSACSCLAQGAPESFRSLWPQVYGPLFACLARDQSNLRASACLALQHCVSLIAHTPGYAGQLLDVLLCLTQDDNSAVLSAAYGCLISLFASECGPQVCTDFALELLLRNVRQCKTHVLNDLFTAVYALALHSSSLSVEGINLGYVVCSERVAKLAPGSQEHLAGMKCVSAFQELSRQPGALAYARDAKAPQLVHGGM
eukprot:Colp12_sorted_trinity150504_noHs@24431